MHSACMDMVGRWLERKRLGLLQRAYELDQKLLLPALVDAAARKYPDDIPHQKTMVACVWETHCVDEGYDVLFSAADVRRL